MRTDALGSSPRTLDSFLPMVRMINGMKQQKKTNTEKTATCSPINSYITAARMLLMVAMFGWSLSTLPV
jgi:hypothetical protein